MVVIMHIQIGGECSSPSGSKFVQVSTGDMHSVALKVGEYSRNFIINDSYIHFKLR